MKFGSNLFKNPFFNWVKNASDEELDNAYEERRQQWIKSGFCGSDRKTPEMEKINAELSRRVAERWKKDPRRNTDSNFRRTDANRWDKD